MSVKKRSKASIYREMIKSLRKEFYGGNYEDFECGNTMDLYVRNPWRCRDIFDRFERTLKKKGNANECNH